EDALLDAKSRNYLTALHIAPQGADGAGPVIALASLDISTGEFELGRVAGRDLGGELSRLLPSEIIATDAALADPQIKGAIEPLAKAAAPVAKATSDIIAAERAPKARLGVAELSGFGDLSRPELAAAAALLKDVELTQIGREPIIRPSRSTGP